ncbi:hypothetical protein [Burkholderia glumae]|uniref:hypothetical protein n=2 Tax=Burkholderia TaxID=32008 RepID=UPI002868F9F7|nr:hypothetical protein [Burkholderia glumae]
MSYFDDTAKEIGEWSAQSTLGRTISRLRIGPACCQRTNLETVASGYGSSPKQIADRRLFCCRPNTDAMEFTVQKLHPALQCGQRLTLTGSNIPAFSFQGSWDGGCAIHAGAMALAMLGCLSDPLRMSSRRRSPEAEFWRRTQQFYLSGMSLDELKTLIRELDWGLQPTGFEGSHAEVLRFCEREVARLRPVILVFRQSLRGTLHAVLVVGIEGRMIGRTFCGHTLLVVDSAETEPVLAAYNARLTRISNGRDWSSGYAQYVTGFDKTKVVLTGAMSIRNRKPSKSTPSA